MITQQDIDNGISVDFKSINIYQLHNLIKDNRLHVVDECNTKKVASVIETLFDTPNNFVTVIPIYVYQWFYKDKQVQQNLLYLTAGHHLTKEEALEALIIDYREKDRYEIVKRFEDTKLIYDQSVPICGMCDRASAIWKTVQKDSEIRFPDTTLQTIDIGIWKFYNLFNEDRFYITSYMYARVYNQNLFFPDSDNIYKIQLHLVTDSSSICVFETNYNKCLETVKDKFIEFITNNANLIKNYAKTKPTESHSACIHCEHYTKDILLYCKDCSFINYSSLQSLYIESVDTNEIQVSDTAKDIYFSVISEAYSGVENMIILL